MFPASPSRPTQRVLPAVLSILLLLAVILSPHPAALAAEGDLDTSFGGASLSNINGPVNALALQADGKTVIAGDFSAVNGITRTRLARLHSDGTLDSSFIPGGGPNLHINDLVIQPDGQILIGGGFTAVNGATRNYIARLNTNGSLDSSFLSGNGPNSHVYAIAVQPNGKVLIGGAFTTVDGATRRRIARLNSDGSVDNSFALANVADGEVHAIAVQPDGKILIGGPFTSVNGSNRFRIARLNSDGSLDTNFFAGAGNSVEAITLQPDGKILIGGPFTAINNLARNYIARLDANGILDDDFAVDGGANGSVHKILVQPDGKIVVGGAFTAIDEMPRNRIARLNADGDVDPAFDIGTGVNNSVTGLGLQADGKIVVGGTFTAARSLSRSRIVRFNPTGSIDITYATNRGPNVSVQPIVPQGDGKILVGGGFGLFDDVGHSGITRLQPDGTIDPSFNPGLGANSSIRAIALQPDGKILIGGEFNAVNGIARGGIARLHANGALDESFAVGGGTNGRVFGLALQPDGKIVIGGSFSAVNNVERISIARLNSDGSLDTTFASGTSVGNQVNSVALDATGNVVIGGLFTSVNGQPRSRLARLSPTGSLDTTFTAGTNDTVYIVAVQSDGKIIVGGEFSQLTGVVRNKIGRLNSNGSLDTTFAPGGGATNTNGFFIHSVKQQADGKIMVGGNFTSFNGVGRNNIARLNPNGSLDFSFAPSGTNGPVYGMEFQADGQLLIGGTFSTINGIARNNLARLRMNGLTPPTSPEPSPSPVPEGPRVFLSHPQLTVGVGQSFQVDLRMDTYNHEVDTLDAYLDFDPAALEVIDAAGNPATSVTMQSGVFDSATINRANNTTGQINLSTSKYEAPFPVGTHTIATMRFRAKAPFDTTSIRFVQTGARQSDLMRAGASLLPSFGNTIVRILEAPVLNGRIALEQRGPINTTRWITQLFRTEGVTTTGGISLYQPGTDTLVGQFAATTDQLGRFSVTLANVPVGTYDIQVKGSNTLSNKRTNIDLSDPTIEHDFGTLRVGDSTGNNTVNGADVSYMIPSFLLTSSDTGFLPYADTNNNGAINGGDVSALVPNFLRAGPLTNAQALTQPVQRMRTRSSTLPTIGMSPALSKIAVGEIVPVQVRLGLGEAEADTLDLYLNFDPQLLEVVDANGQPISSLMPSNAAFSQTNYSRVNNVTGQINLSASRFDAPATGNLAVATFYVRARQLFSSTAITVATTGARQSNLFLAGETLNPEISGGMLSMSDIHRVYVPSALR
ncbi:MAG TPA: hypothetical protein VGD58_25345 [Herpetosiphonaceae bacterium]